MSQIYYCYKEEHLCQPIPPHGFCSENTFHPHVIYILPQMPGWLDLGQSAKHVQLALPILQTCVLAHMACG